MAVDVKAAVIKNMNELQKAISTKSSEVAELEKELDRYKTMLELLSGNGHTPKVRDGNRRRRSSADLREVLSRVPDTFTSKDFVRAGVRTKRQPIYLRQILSRWVKQGRLKRLDRGKYQKIKKTSMQRLAA